MADTQDKLITAEALKYVSDELSGRLQTKVSKSNITLEQHTDGLIYIFVDGAPVGNGVELGTIVEGDVIGTLDENNNIILTGALADGTYTLKYENEDGSYSDVGTLTVSATEPDTPSYTNLADPASADWQEGYRLSLSSGTTSALEGHTTTNYIPFTSGDVVRVKGLAFSSEDTTNGAPESPKLVIYNSSKVKIAGAYGTSAANTDQCYGLSVTVEGDVFTITPLTLNDGTQFDISNATYIRFDGFLLDGYTKNDVIITVNEEITE